MEIYLILTVNMYINYPTVAKIGSESYYSEYFYVDQLRPVMHTVFSTTL
jgi:hypothetical protein